LLDGVLVELGWVVWGEGIWEILGLGVVVWWWRLLLFGLAKLIGIMVIDGLLWWDEYRLNGSLREIIRDILTTWRCEGNIGVGLLHLGLLLPVELLVWWMVGRGIFLEGWGLLIVRW
jgi:hypothetical protein